MFPFSKSPKSVCQQNESHPYKLTVISAALGLIAYGATLLLQIDCRSFPHLQTVMHTLLSIGLYASVIGIDTRKLRELSKTVTVVLLFGVPLKILLPGAILTFLSPWSSGISFLCSTVIAQIDPISTSKIIRNRRMTKKSETILRVWSSFDDPITVLFAFYIFLPIALNNPFALSAYFFQIFRDILLCLVLYIVHKHLVTNSSTREVKSILFASVVFGLGITLNTLLLPAIAGLFFRPFTERQLASVTNTIFFITVVFTGSLAANYILDWYSGFILAFSMFFIGQPITSFLFVRDSMSSRVRVMLGHQNGMTALLLTLVIQSASLQLTSVFSITLSSVIWIMLFYFSSNYIFDLIEAKHVKS
jgi:NhaP-type Na+/H+ or K+/H+ antiporter